jgi:hypothetical protein
MKKFTFLLMAVIATGYFSCKKDNAAPAPSKTTIKKELSLKRDTITDRLTARRDTITDK